MEVAAQWSGLVWSGAVQPGSVSKLQQVPVIDGNLSRGVGLCLNAVDWQQPEEHDERNR